MRCLRLTAAGYVTGWSLFIMYHVWNLCPILSNDATFWTKSLSISYFWSRCPPQKPANFTTHIEPGVSHSIKMRAITLSYFSEVSLLLSIHFSENHIFSSAIFGLKSVCINVIFKTIPSYIHGSLSLTRESPSGTESD